MKRKLSSMHCTSSTYDQMSICLSNVKLVRLYIQRNDVIFHHPSAPKGKKNRTNRSPKRKEEQERHGTKIKKKYLKILNIVASVSMFCFV